eukprot:6182226-Pleurochrysis_carterae.AAC.1
MLLCRFAVVLENGDDGLNASGVSLLLQDVATATAARGYSCARENICVREGVCRGAVLRRTTTRAVLPSSAHIEMFYRTTTLVLIYPDLTTAARAPETRGSI